MDRLGAQIGDQLTRMQAQMQSQLQSQMQALATLLKSQQPTPSTAAEGMVTAAAATLPPFCLPRLLYPSTLPSKLSFSIESSLVMCPTNLCCL